MTVHILGSLNYHNETIVEPIIDELNKNHQSVMWHKPIPANEEGANVHIEACTGITIDYWDEMMEYKRAFKKNDTVFILDFWNPIIFQLKFWSQRDDLNLKFFTIHHGSSHLPGDFASQPGYEWTSAFEDAWFQCYDKVFFGSYNAYDLVRTLSFVNGVVSYLPIDYIKNVKSKCSEKIRMPKTLIMPLRLDNDKGAEEFFTVVRNNPDYIFNCLKFHSAVEIPNLPNLIAHDAMERVALFELMSECEYVISLAKQETFGYGVLEAVSMGCKPILFNSPDNCYHEMYEEEATFYDHNKLKISDYDTKTNLRLRPTVLATPAQEIIVREIIK